MYFFHQRYYAKHMDTVYLHGLNTGPYKTGGAVCREVTKRRWWTLPTLMGTAFCNDYPTLGSNQIFWSGS